MNKTGSILFLLTHGKTTNDYFSSTAHELAQILKLGIDFAATEEPVFLLCSLGHHEDDFGMALSTTVVTTDGQRFDFVYETPEGSTLGELMSKMATCSVLGLRGVQNRLNALV